MNKQLEKYNISVNVSKLTKLKPEDSRIIRRVKSAFYQTESSVCRHPEKPISKIIAIEDENI